MQRKIHLIFKKEVQNIFNSFTSLLDIRIAYFSPEGEELRVGLNKPWCEYCTLLRASSFENQLCLESDRQKRIEAKEKKTMVSYQCHSGLFEAVKPLFLHDGNLLGYIMIGQLRTANEPPAEKLTSADNSANKDALLKAYHEVPFFPDSKLIHILGMFSSLIDYIIQQHMIRIVGKNHLESIITYMEENSHEHLSLGDASKLVGKSESLIAHLFKEELGKSFKDVQADIKLNQADKYMRADSSITIREIAFRLGFNDPLYFSRFYKKKRGCTPSEAKSNIVTG